MKSQPAARIHLMITFVLVTCGAVAGACLGLLLSGRLMALVFAGVAGLGAGVGSFSSRRQVLALFQPDRGSAAADRDAVPADGYAEGLADAALVCIATYQAAVFPLTPDGVAEAEREARRTMAYRISAYEGLPHDVRASAARRPRSHRPGPGRQAGGDRDEGALSHRLRQPRRPVTPADRSACLPACLLPAGQDR